MEDSFLRFASGHSALIFFTHIRWQSLSLVILCAAMGCGGSDMARVSGRVEYVDGSPIQGAIRVIRFEPDDETTATVRKAGSATIGSDGSFEIMTKKPGDGVFKGQYIVTFTVLKDRESSQSLISAKYAAFAQSPFEVDVQQDKTDYLFQLDKLGN